MQNKEIDILQIAQELVARLQKEAADTSLLLQGRIEGVVLLFEEIKKASTISVEKVEAEK